MARRRIGQERLNVGGGNPRRNATLDEMSALIDWTEVAPVRWTARTAGKLELTPL